MRALTRACIPLDVHARTDVHARAHVKIKVCANASVRVCVRACVLHAWRCMCACMRACLLARARVPHKQSSLRGGANLLTTAFLYKKDNQCSSIRALSV